MNQNTKIVGEVVGIVLLVILTMYFPSYPPFPPPKQQKYIGYATIKFIGYCHAENTTENLRVLVNLYDFYTNETLYTDILSDTMIYVKNVTYLRVNRVLNSSIKYDLHEDGFMIYANPKSTEPYNNEFWLIQH